MPFRLWPRPKSSPERVQPQPGALAQEVSRLCADLRVHRIFEWFSSHEREIADFQLAISSIPAPTFGEQARAAWLRDHLQHLGLTVNSDAVENLLAARPGLHAGSPSIAVSAHLDTVFPAATELNIRREQNLLLGPGIGDNGSGLAAIWALASAFHAVGIITTMPLLWIANVCEEGEGNLRGMRHIYREHLGNSSDPIAAAVVGDKPAPPISLLIALDGAGSESVIAQALGSRRFEIVIEGPGGHSWSDHGTPNPIVAASAIIDVLSRIPLPADPRTTLNVGTIQGGTSVNTIPERVAIKVDVRSSDSRRLDEIEQLLRRAVPAACTEIQSRSLHSGCRLRHFIVKLGERPAGDLSPSSPLLAAVHAVDAQLGIRSLLLRASTDSNIPLSLGLEAVTLGAGGNGGGAHTLGEWFDPAGREQGLKRIALLILLVAGLPPEKIPTPAPQDFR
ncbi:MAG: peptidase M20 [Acidobacteria bacterium]|nr:MAG: peptidase M20 [Acidobacteriota bacterium]